MSFTIGKNFRVTLFGQSHAEKIGCVIEGITPGTRIDYKALTAFMKRRQGGGAFSTPRKEHDVPNFITGIGPDGTVCEGPLVVTIDNCTADSTPYTQTRHIPRPSHADFVSYMTYDKHEDWRGGGAFSARLTAPLCAAGAIAKQILKERNIEIDAHLLQVGDVSDESFAAGITYGRCSDKPSDEYRLHEQISTLHQNDFPCINKDNARSMQNLIRQVKAEGDSIGSCIECVVVGLPIGVGEPYFDGIDAQLSHALFSLPAVKSFEMGVGDACVSARGSELNDPIRYIDDKPTITTNNSGGCLGGLTTGNPLIFKAGFKPTPTISKPQETINISTKENITYAFEGRHDPCVGVRAVSVVEAITAIVILDNLIDFDMRQTERNYTNNDPKPIDKTELDDIDNSSMRIGLLGKDISHSLSPLLHQMISGRPYELFDMDEDQAKEFIKSDNYHALNVTIPYKEMAYKLTSCVTNYASDTDAVNTIIHEYGSTTGDNTDYHGFLVMLEDFLRKKLSTSVDNLAGKKVIVLGNGGASKAVQAVLRNLRAHTVVISRRGPHTYDELCGELHKDAFLLVNTTPVGMSPNAPASPIDFDTLKNLEGLQGVIDLIYNPAITLIGFWAQKLKIAYTSGMLMLVEQGIESARLFGTIAEDEVIDSRDIYNKMISLSKNIVLIGMPSVGKSTIGKVLADKLGRPFVDTDSLFETKYDMSPAEYIKKYGEDSFRDLEAKIVREVANLTGHVISCGGGVVCREENLYPLKQNSQVVYLKRPLNELTSKFRPISSRIGIEKLYEVRQDLYVKFANTEVDVQATPELTADKIAFHLSL